MFDTYFLAETLTIGERHNIGLQELIRVFDATIRAGMTDVTDKYDETHGMTVFANPSASLVLIAQIPR